jgi:hypothetical protein
MHSAGRRQVKDKQTVKLETLSLASSFSLWLPLTFRHTASMLAQVLSLSQEEISWRQSFLSKSTVW